MSCYQAKKLLQGWKLLDNSITRGAVKKGIANAIANNTITPEEARIIVDELNK